MDKAAEPSQASQEAGVDQLDQVTSSTVDQSSLAAAAQYSVPEKSPPQTIHPRSVYCTLLTNINYLPGLLVLHKCLRDVGSKYPLVVMTTPSLTQQARDIAEGSGLTLRPVQDLKPAVKAKNDKRLNDAWTKLRAYDLVEYDRIVLLDSDMIVRLNMDELLDIDLPGPEWIASTHACACNPRKYAHYPSDWIPENCAYTPLTWDNAATHTSPSTGAVPRPYTLLNSGMVVLKPSHDMLATIVHFLETSPLVPEFRFADQDLFGEVFRERWRPLPYVYNALKTMRWVHSAIWRDEEIRCLHYILDDKPWNVRPSTRGTTEEEIKNNEMKLWWWEIYDSLIVEMKAREGSGWEVIEEVVARLTGKTKE